MKQLFTYLFLVIFLFGCGESEPNPEPEPPEELIPPSQVGAGFVSCLINGEVWNVRGQIGSSLTNGGLVIGTGKLEDNRQEAISIQVNNVTIEGIYSLYNENPFAFASYNVQTLENGRPVLMSYQTNTEHNGELIITHLDTKENIISSIFWFDAHRESTGEIIEIQDGRFDIRF